MNPTDHEPIRGTHGVSFRALVEADIPALMRWERDPEVMQFWGTPPADEAAARAAYLEPQEIPAWRFAIELERRPVGFIQYYTEGYADRPWSAGIDVYIGEPDRRNGGVGTEAVRTMLAYLFEVKRLHRVTIDPQTENARAIRAYEKAGFVRDGVLRHNDFMHGRYVDTLMLSILETEWPEAKARWLAERG